MSQPEQLVLEIGRALHRYGTPAHRLEQALDHVARQLGLEGQFFCTPTSIIAAFGPLGEQRAGLVRVEPGAVELGKLARLDLALQDLAARRSTPAQALDVVRNIADAPPTWPPLATLASFALCSAAGGRIFGGGWADIAVAAAIGALLGILERLMGRSSAPHLFEPVGAAVATALAVLAGAAHLPVRVEIVTLAGVLYLLPGLTLTVAATELSTRHFVSGTARLVMAVLSLLLLGFGVALGGRLALLLPALAAAPPEAVFPWWADLVAIALAGLSFTVLFQARLRDAPWILLSVGLAYGGARLGTASLGPQVGAFLGALAVGVGSNLYARLRCRPALVPLVPGVLLLVPGSIGFRSVSWLLRGDTVLAVDAAFDMVMVAVALAVGLLAANVVVAPRKDL